MRQRSREFFEDAYVIAFVIVGLLANPNAREQTWRFVKKRWSRLRRRIAPLLVSRVIGATPLLATREYRRDVAAFFKENPAPSSERTLRQALERFDAALDFDRRAGTELVHSLEELA